MNDELDPLPQTPTTSRLFPTAVGVFLRVALGLVIAYFVMSAAAPETILENAIRDRTQADVECQAATTPAETASVMKAQFAADRTPRLLGNGMVCAW